MVLSWATAMARCPALLSHHGSFALRLPDSKAPSGDMRAHQHDALVDLN